MASRYQILWTEKIQDCQSTAFAVRGHAATADGADAAHRVASAISAAADCGSVRIVDAAQFGVIVARYVDGERITTTDPYLV